MAALVDSGLSFDQVARLTDRQISEIICHKRDKGGQLKPPHDTGDATGGAPNTLEGELQAVDQLAAFLAATGATVDVAELKAKVRARYAGQPA